MKRKFLIFLSFFVFICFLGCSGKEAKIKAESKAVQMLIISPLVRINDGGFIHFDKNAIKVQIYGAGAGLLELKIAEQICINGACEPAQSFNQKFFGAGYYDKILADIIASKALFGSKGEQNSCGGFSQKTSDIEYEVCPTKTSFKNKKAKIIFSTN